MYVLGKIDMTPASQSDVQVIDIAFRGDYILGRIADTIGTLTDIQKTNSERCEAQITAMSERCKKCQGRCGERRKMNPDLIELALPLIFPGYVLGCTVTEVIVSTASKALNKFGKNSVKYLEKVGKIAENLGKSIMKDGDKILKLTGTNLEAIGKKLEDTSKELLKVNADGVKHASKQIIDRLKDTIKGVQRVTKPLLKGSVKLLKDIGKSAGKAVIDIGKSAGKVVTDIGKSAGKVVTDIGKGIGQAGRRISTFVRNVYRHRIKLSLPPRVRASLPPRVRVSRPRVRVSRSRVRVIVSRISFGRFSGWGKKRDSSGCGCFACDPFDDGVSTTEMIESVCGLSYLPLQEQTIKELNSLLEMHNFTMENQILKGIDMDFSSLTLTSNGYYLNNTIMTLLTPKSNEILIKMEKGMPLPGMKPLNVEDIVNAEAAKVYDALI